MPLYSLEGVSAQSAATGVPTATIMDLYNVVEISVIYVACCLSFTIWDWVTSLSLEYRAIWKARWSLVKVLYIAARICIIFANAWCLYLWAGSFTAEECQRFYRSQVVVYIPNELIATALLFLRVYAVSRKNKIVAGIFTFMFLVQAVSDFVIMARGMAIVPTFALSGSSYCIAGGGPLHNFATAFWAFPVANVVVATGIMIFFIRRIHRSGSSGLARVIYNEGIVYMIVILIVNSINIAFFAQTGWTQSSINAPASISITAIMANRLVLSLHREANVGSSGSNKRTGKDSFWAGRSAVMEPLSRTAPTANTFQLNPQSQAEHAHAGSMHSEFGEDKQRESLGTPQNSDAPFAVALYPAAKQVRVHLDQHVYSEGDGRSIA